MPSLKNIPYKFIFFTLLFLIADFVIENINHRFQLGDFKVYYEAANAICNGKQVYGVLFSLAIGYYKYSPFTALLFYPLSILPYYYACVIDFFLISVAVVCTSIIILNIFSNYIFKEPIKSPNLILSISLLCICTHLVREIALGNVNIILLLVLCLSLFFLIREEFVLAGILLAFVLITKPFFIILIIPLVMRRYFKTLLVTAITLLAFMLLPALILGVTNNIAIHKQWLNTMLLHADSFPAPNTIEALVRHYFSFAAPFHFQYIVMVVLLVPYVLFIFKNISSGRKDENKKTGGLVMEWFVLIAMIPSMFKTDTEHFLMTLPIILFIIMYLFSNKNLLLTILFVVLIILYAGNSSDLLGKNMSLTVYNLGVLGISNILIIALALFIYTRKIIGVEKDKLLSDTKSEVNRCNT